MNQIINLLPTPFSDDELIEYLTSKKVRWQCESCSNNEWELLSNDEYPAHGYESIKTNGDGLSAHMRCILLSCTNCHFLRSYQWGPFNTWLTEKRKKSAEAQE
jgi:hypothetical protein